MLVKDINPNLSGVVNGNNVTLQQVSLTQNGSSFTFICIPADYSYAANITSVDAAAEYTINGTTRSAGTAGYGDDTSRWIKLVWGGNYPLTIVPKDVNEITFTITSISVKTVDTPPFSLGGPWIFKIPLQ